jgi:hypothetical protein
MNYYGDETYFTQGAFHHVVGLMYLKDKPLKKKSLFPHKYYLIHSMMENLGYFIHSYYSKKHKFDIIYAIKYFSRFISAVYWLSIITEKTFKSKIKQLLDLTEDMKSYIRNRNNQEIFNHYFANLIETDDNDLIANLVHLFKEKKIKTIKELIDNKEPLIYLLELLKMSIDNNLRSTTLRITRDGDIFTVNIDPIL